MRPTKIMADVVLALAVGSARLAAGQAPAPAPASPRTPAPASGRGGPSAPTGGGGFANAYPQHAQADAATVARGKQVYGVNCSFCHGSDARGGEGGPNLL